MSGEEWKTWQGRREIEEKTYDGKARYLKCCGHNVSPHDLERERATVRVAGGGVRRGAVTEVFLVTGVTIMGCRFRAWSIADTRLLGMASGANRPIPFGSRYK